MFVCALAVQHAMLTTAECRERASVYEHTLSGNALKKLLTSSDNDDNASRFRFYCISIPLRRSCLLSYVTMSC